MNVLVLDRDGVVNADSPDYIKHPDEWLPIPGSVEAIARASADGYTIAIATNQSGVGRGYFDLDMLSAINDKMIEAVEAAGGRIDVIAFCPHKPDEGCDCRKPKAGLLQRIESELGTPLAGQWMVGDSMKDINAARSMSMQPVLVRTGNGTRTEGELADADDVLVFDSLAAAVDNLLEDR